MNNKIKAIFFDFDGVMTLDKTGSDSICNYISREANIDKNIFEKEYRKFNKDLLVGKTTHLIIWEQLCKNIDTIIPISVLYDSFINTPTDKLMYELILKIKQFKLLTGLITDNKADRMEKICDYYGYKKIFDIIAVSGELGYGKESEKIFLKVLSDLKIKAEETIFIDNTEKNLLIPQKLGIKVIHFNDSERSMEKLKEEIINYGVNI